LPSSDDQACLHAFAGGDCFVVVVVMVDDGGSGGSAWVM